MLTVDWRDYDKEENSRTNYQREFGWELPKPTEEAYDIVGTVSAPEKTFYNDYEK